MPSGLHDNIPSATAATDESAVHEEARLQDSTALVMASLRGPRAEAPADLAAFFRRLVDVGRLEARTGVEFDPMESIT